MRLQRLTVKHLRCVEQAAIKFGPGLNVLFGENDIGKSTLAQAIRAALLLPHTSSAGTALHSWVGGPNPSVELTFSTKPGAFWQVAKTFGSPGSSELRFSKDDSSYEHSAKGRKVDGELRELLKWGIRGPGGHGAPKGLPASFLSHALLGEQVSITKLFEVSLEDDSNDSARTILEGALSAMAQDPVFKAVLECAQVKVNEAFTATGKRKTGKKSPYHRMGQRIRELQDQLARERDAVDKSDRARQELVSANERLNEARQALVVAKAKATEVSQRTKLAGELDSAQERVKVATQWVREIEDFAAGVDTATQALDQLRTDHKALVATCEAQELALASAQTTLSQAQLRLVQSQSQEGDHDRTLRIANARREVAELETLYSAVTLRLQEARKAAAARVTMAEASAACSAAQGRFSQAESAVDQARTKLAATQEHLTQLQELNRLARVREAQQLVQAAREAAVERQARIDAAAAASCEAAQVQAQVDAMRLPDEHTFTALQTLDRDLQVALAQVSVGMAATLSPTSKLEIRLATDDGPPRTVEVSEPTTVEADRVVELLIAGVGQLRVVVGNAHQRQRAELLRQRWTTEATPVLEMAGAVDLASLRALLDDQARLVTEAERLREQASSANGDAEDLRVRAAQLASDEAKLLECESGLSTGDRVRVEARAAGLGPRWMEDLEARIASADKSLRADQQAVQQHTDLLHRAATELATLREREAAARRSFDDLGNLGDLGSHGVVEPAKLESVADLQARSERLANDLAARRVELQTLSEQGSRELADSEAAVTAAKQAVEVHNDQLQAIQDRARTTHDKVIAADSRLTERRRRLAAMELDAALEQASAAKAQLAALPRPQSGLQPGEADLAEAAVLAATDAVEGLTVKAAAAQGAFEQLGGEVAREELNATSEAHVHAKREELELELDFDAYKLLAETLREVENTEGAHLGERLGKDVSDRFRDLTGYRYGDVSLDAHLRTRGIAVAGADRDLGELSSGTQDQLATVLRLTIAEQLGTALILDDHLAQTHRRRAAWFSAVLQKAADHIQIIVLTARSEDYLAAEQIAVVEDTRDFAGGSIRAINMDRVIQRVSYGGAGS